MGTLKPADVVIGVKTTRSLHGRLKLIKQMWGRESELNGMQVVSVAETRTPIV